MAIQVSGTQVIGNSRELTNIASVDATTAASITAAGVGGASGEQAFTADEALTAGDVLGLNSSGKVVKRGALVSPKTQTYSDEWNEKYFFGTWDEDNEFFIYGIGYWGPGSDRKIGYVVGEVNANGTLSVGGGKYTGPAGYSRNLGMCYDTNANKAVGYIFDNGSGVSRPRAVVITVNSNKTLSFGSLTNLPFAQDSYYSRGVCFDPSTNKCLFVGSSGPYTYDVRACVGTVSGTSISFGSATSAGGSGTAQNDRVAIHVPGANKNVVVWLESRSSKFNIVAKSTTISGTSVSFGSEGSVVPNGNFQQEGLCAIADPTSGSSKFLAVCYDSTDDQLCGYVGTLSGTSVSFGSKVVLSDVRDFVFPNETSVTVRSQTVSLSPIPNSNDILVAFHVRSSSARRIFSKTLTVSGTNILTGPTNEVVKEGSTNADLDESKAFILPDYTENKVVMTTAIYNNSLRTTSSQAIQGAPAKFVGIAAENISSGSSGKVTVVGGTNTSVSGLTAGFAYGLNSSSGDLQLLSPDVTGRVGRAISATSLYIDNGFDENN
jgi:hypothetical protein